MAKVRTPLLSEDAAGSVGSVTHFRNRGLHVTRRRSIPSQPRSARQLVVRNLLATLSREWGSLTDDQRTAWKQYADDHPQTDSMGQQIHLSGFNAYCSLNFFRCDWAGTSQTTPPTTPPPASLKTLTESSGDLGVGEVGMAYTITYFGTESASDKMDVQVTSAMPSAGRVAQESDFVHYSYDTGNAGGCKVIGLVDGCVYYIRVRYIDQYGQVTVALEDQFTAVTGT